MKRRPQISTLTDTPCPYTTLSRSGAGEDRRSAIGSSLLGRLQVRDADGAEIAISVYKARALLGYLAVSLGNAIPRSHLATMLWGGRSDRQEIGRAHV